MPPIPPMPPAMSLLGLVRDHRVGGEDHGRDRGSVLESGARYLDRVDDSGFDHVDVLAGRRVEALAFFEGLDLLDDDVALHAAVLSDEVERLGHRLANDLGSGLHVAFEFRYLGVEGLHAADERYAAAGDDAFFNRRAGRVEGVFYAELEFLLLGLGGRADLDDRYAADELRKALLELLLVVLGGGVGVLFLDLSRAVLDGLRVAAAFDYRRGGP